ncbi:threonine-phosphate decarboxylase CobD [Cohnella terricola]|uniref:threonine-phosphate decarboxylase n=1 Tax=Cohnella terricola TaxID=1289167 RepID=A0A559JWU5_9BACL|nr:threonine-phosphate decarboxylase CobD [Cohnella terricola]TVY04363.1 threonine-phosphate decarboxylase [Cohnella terricola]
MNNGGNKSILEPYGHGGDLLTASGRFGIAPGEWLDYSANINPLGPPPQALDALADGMRAIVNYPDPAHRELKRLLAAKLNVAENELLIGNGAAECIALALMGLDIRKVGVIAPCFSEYAQLAADFGAEVHTVVGKEENGFRADPAELRDLLREVDLLFVGHPNNPTGLTYSLDQLRAIADLAEEHSAYVVIDEAFMDFLPPEERPTLLPELRAYPHVVLMHSMTKFYAIPGLRLGYAIASPQIVERMARKQVTWSVNGLALLAGQACLSPEITEYEARTRELISQEREFLQDHIVSRLGWQVWHGEANFLLIRVAEPWTAGKLQDDLGPKGIMIRSCAMYEGLTERDIRIAVRGRVDNERLINAFVEVDLEREMKHG